MLQKRDILVQLRVDHRQIGRYIPRFQYIGFDFAGEHRQVPNCSVIGVLPQGQVAQLVEQWTENPRVGSATLPLSTLIPFRVVSYSVFS
jgi:hypothetical protein